MTGPHPEAVKRDHSAEFVQMRTGWGATFGQGAYDSRQIVGGGVVSGSREHPGQDLGRQQVALRFSAYMASRKD